MVSVIIPSFNHGNYLSETLNSVIAQTYKNWECIIVNDGSSDNTKAIAQDYVSKDERITYLWKKNGGLSSARNAGLEKAKGDWIQFLDADDIIEPEKFQKQLSVINKNGIFKNVVSYTDYRYGTDDDIRQEIFNHIKPVFKTATFLGELITRWETSLIIPPHCFLFSADFFLQGIRFEKSLRNHEDFDCWLAIFSQNPEVVFVDEILCRYRRSNNSMSSNMKLMGEGFLQVINKHIKIKSYSPGIRSLLKQKRLDVLQRYKRFNLMSFREKIASWKILSNHYSSRISQKVSGP